MYVFPKLLRPWMDHSGHLWASWFVVRTSEYMVHSFSPALGAVEFCVHSELGITLSVWSPDLAMLPCAFLLFFVFLTLVSRMEVQSMNTGAQIKRSEVAYICACLLVLFVFMLHQWIVFCWAFDLMENTSDFTQLNWVTLFHSVVNHFVVLHTWLCTDFRVFSTKIPRKLRKL